MRPELDIARAPRARSVAGIVSAPNRVCALHPGVFEGGASSRSEAAPSLEAQALLDWLVHKVDALSAADTASAQ
jgi:hypothetical protein